MTNVNYSIFNILATDIYFLAKGSAIVKFTDTAKQSYDNFRTLHHGDHFGEIGIVFNCPRTAGVISSDYCTFAKLPI